MVSPSANGDTAKADTEKLFDAKSDDDTAGKEVGGEGDGNRCFGLPVHDSPTLSKSRISTAISARFAASASSVKSLRKVSVEGALTGCGAGGTILLVGDSCVDDRAEACVVDEMDRGSISFSLWVATVAGWEWEKKKKKKRGNEGAAVERTVVRGDNERESEGARSERWSGYDARS